MIRGEGKRVYRGGSKGWAEAGLSPCRAGPVQICILGPGSACVHT
jgi:hypothetical protein